MLESKRILQEYEEKLLNFQNGRLLINLASSNYLSPKVKLRKKVKVVLLRLRVNS